MITVRVSILSTRVGFCSRLEKPRSGRSSVQLHAELSALLDRVPLPRALLSCVLCRIDPIVRISLLTAHLNILRQRKPIRVGRRPVHGSFRLFESAHGLSQNVKDRRQP